MEVAERIVRRISEPFSLSGKIVSVGASVGIAFVDQQTQDASEVLRNADTAMYRAKNAGKGQVAVFDESMHAEVLRRLERESQLRHAISEKLFQLHYQPIVNLQTAEVQGVEVLIRWKDKSGAYVSPAEFIPIIEEIGLISEVGEWVLQTSMQEMNQVLREVPGMVAKNLAVGVNTSPRQLADPFFIDLLDEIIERTGFDRKRLKLEMGEAQDGRHAERIREAMLALHDRGIGIQIDDFGKGQSSLTSFQNYSIEAVKIDRSFTRLIATDRTHAVIAESIVSLAHHLSAKIVAEGVESADQLDALKNWGCDAAQGYLFSPPLCYKDLTKFLSNPDTSEGIGLLKGMTACESLLA
jgi:EAL domain-containing protein (putative c-di-GMP-specific phosphodiesterase class I)